MIELPQNNTEKIINSLNSDKVVALPTETVFGLAVSLNSKSALEKLIKIKNREINSGKVFTLVPESKESIKKYALIPETAKSLIETYFPGELTLILPKNPAFNHPYFDNFDSVGLRIPDFPLFSQILEKTGPLLLTSANPRGKSPAITSNEVKSRLPEIDILVAGKSNNNPPSTILDLTTKIPRVLRQGSPNPLK